MSDVLERARLEVATWKKLGLKGDMPDKIIISHYVVAQAERIAALEAENARLRKIVAAVQIERMENWGQPMILHNMSHAISHKMECALCAALEEPEGGTNG